MEGKTSRKSHWSFITTQQTVWMFSYFKCSCGLDVSSISTYFVYKNKIGLVIAENVNQWLLMIFSF